MPGFLRRSHIIVHSLYTTLCISYGYIFLKKLAFAYHRADDQALQVIDLEKIPNQVAIEADQ